jgi:hypothetical protein
VILEKLLEADKNNKILISTQLEGGQIYVNEAGNKEEKKVLLSEFSKNQSNRRYLEHQLILFSQLCSGRHSKNIQIISQLISFDQAVTGVKNSQLKGKLRAAYADILHNLYIDVDPNQPILMRIQMSYVWDELGKNPANVSSDKSLSGVIMDFFPPLRDWIKGFLKENQVIVCSKEQIDYNIFLASLLNIVKSLVLFGYYKSEEDIENLLRPLYDLLQGHNDSPISSDKSDPEIKIWRKSGRFQNNSVNRPVFDIKSLGLAIIDLFLNLGFSKLLAKFFSDFKNLKSNESGYPDTPTSDRKSSKHNNHAIDLSRFAQLLSKGVDTLPPDLVHEYLHSLKQSFEFLDPDHQLQEVCMDLARYDSKKLVVSALNVVNRSFSMIEGLFTDGNLSKLLVNPESIKNFSRITEILPSLRRLIGLKLENEHFQEMKKIIDELIQFCSLSDVTEPHPSNQHILINAHVISDIMEIFRKPVDIGLKEKYAGLIEIRKSCFVFLKLFCRKNRYVQSRLFVQLDELLHVEGAERELGLMIAEMFADNEELAMKFREEHIKKLVELLAKHQYHELWIALNAIARIGFFPLKRNQNFVIKYLMQNRDRTILYVDKKDTDYRIHLMHQGTIQKNGGKIDPVEFSKAMYHQFQMRTLATCAEGENRLIEAMLQNIMSLDQVFHVLSDDKIHFDFKRPYLRFLIWVFLATAAGKSDSGVTDVQYDPRLWDLCEDVINRVTEIGKKDLSTLSVKSPMDSVYLFEAAFTFFATFYERYYTPSPDLQKKISSHEDITKRIFDVCLDFYIKMRKCPNFCGSKERRRLNFLLQIFISNHFCTEEQFTQYEG